MAKENIDCVVSVSAMRWSKEQKVLFIVLKALTTMNVEERGIARKTKLFLIK